MLACARSTSPPRSVRISTVDSLFPLWNNHKRGWTTASVFVRIYFSPSLLGNLPRSSPAPLLRFRFREAAKGFLQVLFLGLGWGPHVLIGCLTEALFCGFEFLPSCASTHSLLLPSIDGHGCSCALRPHVGSTRHFFPVLFLSMVGHLWLAPHFISPLGSAWLRLTPPRPHLTQPPPPGHRLLKPST